jgi:DNA-binding NarL/FixJ family response regulator
VSVLARRLLVVEDERLMASMLGDLLRQAGYEVAIAHSALEAVELADSTDPDGALIDIHLGPGPTGLHLGQRLAHHRPALRLIFMSRFGVADPARTDHDALPAHSSFINKELIHDPAELLTLIDSALSTDTFLLRRQQHPDHPLRTLTDTQLQILRLAATGLTNLAIATQLGSSVRNVEQRLARVYETLGIAIDPHLNPRVEAIRQYVTIFGLPNEHN